MSTSPEISEPISRGLGPDPLASSQRTQYITNSDVGSSGFMTDMTLLDLSRPFSAFFFQLLDQPYFNQRLPGDSGAGGFFVEFVKKPFW